MKDQDQLLLQARTMMTELPMTEDAGRMMYMPGGTHFISCGAGPANKATAEVTLLVDSGTAAVLNASLRQRNEQYAPQRALFDKEHEGKEAMAWPTGFIWSELPQPGVYADVEYSSLGASYIQGKVMRAFSPSFFSDADLPKGSEVKAGKTYQPAAGRRGSDGNPARITGLAFPYAGTLTNNPAFHEILPLWAKDSNGPKKDQGELPSQREAFHQGTNERTNNKPVKESKQMNEQEKLALQARLKVLESELTVLRAREQTAETATEIETREAELTAGQARIESAELKARNAELENAAIDQREKDADAAVKAAVKRGALPPQSDALHATWKKKCIADPEMIEILANLKGSPALERQRLTLPSRVTIQRDDSVTVLNAFSAERDPHKRAALYGTIKTRVAEGDPMPLHAANSLGTLAGTIVSQRTLELLKLAFPILSSISTDFSDQQSKLNQTIESRIVGIPAVVDYDPVNGWTDSDQTTTDVPVTLNKQKGVSLTLTADVVASTVRRLFDEFAPAQAYALAKNMVDALYTLFTAVNYTNAATVAAQIDFARSTLISAGVALDKRGVPDGPMNRFCLLNADYYGQLESDASLVTLSAFQKPEIIEQGVLPNVQGFRVVKAVNLPGTGNLTGFAGSRSSCLMAARIDGDYTSILPGASYGSVTTVTDPDLGLSVQQVQYVNHQKASVTQRISLIYGVALGQVNAGQLIKSA